MIDVSHVWKKSYILESTMWMSIINVYDRCPINMNMMDVHHLWIWWMSIIYEWDEYPSCMMNARIEFNMSVIDMFDGCPSNLMYYSHKCPSYMWTSFVMEPMESFSRRNKLKRYGEFWSIYGIDGIRSERMLGIWRWLK